MRRAIRSPVFRLGLKLVPGLRNSPGLDQIPAITDWLTELILGKETAERERAEDEALALELLGPQGMRALEIAEAVIDIRDLLKKGGPIRGGMPGPANLGGPALGIKAPSILQPYRRGRGHHVPAKKIFEGMPGFHPREAIAIPKKVLAKLRVSHPAITGAQQVL